MTAFKDIQEPLSLVLKVAAELAREGRCEDALRLRNAHDEIRQAICDHSKGYASHLMMSGRIDRCKTCGKEK